MYSLSLYTERYGIALLYFTMERLRVTPSHDRIGIRHTHSVFEIWILRHD
jgi:hypothetical protein